MKSIAIIPIKHRSTRVVSKNFRMLGGRKLYEYIIQHTLSTKCFDEICVDTDSSEIKIYAQKYGVTIIDRLPWLASDEANGNDLLVHHWKERPGFDFYFQLFATAPFLHVETIQA